MRKIAASTLAVLALFIGLAAPAQAAGFHHSGGSVIEVPVGGGSGGFEWTLN